MGNNHRLLKTIALIAALLFSLPALLADDSYLLEILPTKKVIYVKNTGLPGNTSIHDMLMMMPELLNRGSDDLFDNYDIQYDGKSTESGRDAILLNTWIGEIEKVEITTSPTVTQQKNGVSGIINIIPHQLNEGFGGEAALTGTTEWDVIPTVNLEYKNKKLELRGGLSLEYYRPTFSSRIEDVSDVIRVVETDTTRQRYCQETAKLSMKYKFSDKDNIKAWVWESWSNDFQETSKYRMEGPVTLNLSSTDGLEVTRHNTAEKDLNVTAIAEYEHFFNAGAKVNVTANYQYNKLESVTGTDEAQSAFISGHINPNNLNGEVKFTIPVSSIRRGAAAIETGVNSTYQSDIVTANRSSSLYLSPFFTFKYEGDVISANGGVRYTYYSRSCSFGDEPTFRRNDHDILGNVNVVWQIVPHHALRFLTARNLLRPTDMMLYPEPLWIQSQGEWHVGDKDIMPAHVTTAELSYIFDHKDGGHSLMTNVGVQYDYANGLFEQHRKYDSDLRAMVVTYTNSGKNNIINGNVALNYSYGMFSLAFGGNLFYNIMSDSGKVSDYFSYVLSLTPVLSFPQKWTVSLNALYNSKARKGNTFMGDYFYAQIRINKSFNRWTVHAALSDIFHYHSESYTVSTKHETFTSNDLYSRFIELGVSRRFGVRR